MTIFAPLRIPRSVALPAAAVTAAGIVGALASGTVPPLVLAVVAVTPPLTAVLAMVARYLVIVHADAYADEAADVEHRAAARTRTQVTA